MSTDIKGVIYNISLHQSGASQLWNGERWNAHTVGKQPALHTKSLNICVCIGAYTHSGEGQEFGL